MSFNKKPITIAIKAGSTSLTYTSEHVDGSSTVVERTLTLKDQAGEHDVLHDELILKLMHAKQLERIANALEQIAEWIPSR